MVWSMGFFGKLFGGGTPQVDAQLVAAWANPWDAEMADIVDSVNVDRLLELYGLQGEYLRTWLVGDFGQAALANSEAWLQRLAQPGTPHERMFLGSIHSHLGWARRGTRVASLTDGDDLDAFSHHLITALQLHLEAAREMAPEDMTAYAEAQSCTFPLPTEQVMQVAAEWRAIDPYFRAGLQYLGDVIDERWSGVPHAQLELAEEVALRAPSGNPGLWAVPTLIAHRWDYLANFAGIGFDAADAQTVRSPRVQQYLEAAYRKLGPIDPAAEVITLNRYLWCFYHGGNVPLAHEVLQRVDGRVDADMWNFRDSHADPLAEFIHAHGNITRAAR